MLIYCHNNGISSNISAPVTPSHSPPTEKSNNSIDIIGTNKQPKYDSLLDQIMALPRETIEARIKQFGGSVNCDDETRILVTKLFQLLSGHSKPKPCNNNNNNNNNKPKPSYSNSEIVSSVQSIHNTPLQQNNTTNNSITCISPQNELIYQQRQVSQESIKSHHSHH